LAKATAINYAAEIAADDFIGKTSRVAGITDALTPSFLILTISNTSGVTIAGCLFCGGEHFG
jgi:hypothetical protein